MTVAFSPSEIGRGMKAVPNQSHLGPREKNAIQLSRFNGLYHMTEATAMTKSIQEQTPDAPVVDLMSDVDGSGLSSFPNRAYPIPILREGCLCADGRRP